MSDIKKESENVQFRFLSFFVQESHIVLKEQGEYNINVNFNPRGYIFSQLNQFHLELGVEVSEAANKFNIVVKAIAIFEFDSGTEIEKYKSNYFVLNAPAILFPYIRAYISNLTTQSGLFTVTLPTLNLSSLSDTLRQNIVEMN